MAWVGGMRRRSVVRIRRSTAGGKRWIEKGIFARMMAGLAAEHGEEKTVMIPSRDITP